MAWKSRRGKESEEDKVQHVGQLGLPEEATNSLTKFRTGSVPIRKIFGWQEQENYVRIGDVLTDDHDINIAFGGIRTLLAAFKTMLVEYTYATYIFRRTDTRTTQIFERPA